jgi:hypothetical protein
MEVLIVHDGRYAARDVKEAEEFEVIALGVDLENIHAFNPRSIEQGLERPTLNPFLTNQGDVPMVDVLHDVGLVERSELGRSDAVEVSRTVFFRDRDIEETNVWISPVTLLKRLERFALWLDEYALPPMEFESFCQWIVRNPVVGSDLHDRHTMVGVSTGEMRADVLERQRNLVGRANQRGWLPA